MCQTQHIRLPHIEEEEEFDISNKTSPVEDDKVEKLPTDIKNSVIRIKQIRTIFNPNTLTTKTTTTTTSAYPPSHRQHPGLGFTSSIKLNRLLKRGILRGANSSNNNQTQTSSTPSDTSSILHTTAAQIQKAQQKSKESNNTSNSSAAASSGSHVGQQQASPAKMQAEQGSIGDLQKYHSRYLKNRRHTLANVR